MPTRSRRKTPIIAKSNTIIAANGVELNSLYCRKCCKNKKPSEFFTATDLFLDTSTRMSVCKSCVDDMYKKTYASERNIEKTLYKLCKILNVKYDGEVVNSTIESLNKRLENDKELENVFGLYKARLSSSARKFVGDKTILHDNLTFNDTPPVFNNTETVPDYVPEAIDLKQIWGSNYSYDDFVFLEAELSEWSRTHKSDTHAEKSLLMLLCHKALLIRKTRETGGSTASLEKEYQDLMKTANVDPAKTAMAGSGKAQDTYSGIIKLIESTTPAEFYKDKTLFRDYDNIEWYFKKFVTRPLSNFLGITRLFSLEDNADDGDDNFDETILDIVDKDKGE